MTKHFVLSLNPTAEYDWDRCTLRDPITAERPELAHLIAEAVGKQSGSYLVSVNIEVTVLEKAANPQPRQLSTLPPAESNGHSHPQELVA